MSSIAERYARAVRSSHLEVKTEPGAIDVLTAAGYSDSLGTMLLRCRQEWDSQRAEVERTADDALTSRALILMNMGSLRPCVEAMGRWAANRANRRSMTLQPHEIARAAGNALDIWLDQRCNACAGRGRNGGYGAPQLICQACKGRKIRRRVLPSKSADEYTLGEWLIAEADRLVEAAERRMVQVLR